MVGKRNENRASALRICYDIRRVQKQQEVTMLHKSYPKMQHIYRKPYLLYNTQRRTKITMIFQYMVFYHAILTKIKTKTERLSALCNEKTLVSHIQWKKITARYTITMKHAKPAYEKKQTRIK